MSRQNVHHLFWQKRDYKDSVGRALRDARGMSILMDVEVHNELHADMFPPPKPNRNLMLGILNNLEEQRLVRPIDGLLFTIDYVENKHEKLAAHLYQQLGFVIMGVECENQDTYI